LVEVGIVGLGAWGLCSLERLIDTARHSTLAEVTVHVVEPGRPGGGLYSQTGPDYLILNTPCGQHSMYPYPDQLDGRRLGKGFYEWAAKRGYRWHGYECRTSGPGQPISPHDFLPRRLMGEYLEWFYGVLLLEAPPNVTVVQHKTKALDIQATSDGRERVYLEDGSKLELDHVILTMGHLGAIPRLDGDNLAIAPYPVERYVDAIGPGDKIAIEGMGLVALDVITALTIGLGGWYTSELGGKLRYHRSGREPSIYMFSRAGYPYWAKSVGTADPVGGYQPAICTAEAIASLRQLGHGPQERAIDARDELLPLVFAEMELRFYVHSALLKEGPEGAEVVREKLVAGWRAGIFSEACSDYEGRYGRFKAADYVFVGQDATFIDGKDYESHVYAAVEADVNEALVPGGASPVKAALETLRALRDILRLAVEFKGLTLASYLDFQSNLQGRLARAVAGAPVFRSQQLLALVDAEVIRLPFGPSPEVRADRRGHLVVRSTRLERPSEIVFDRVIRAHLETPVVGRSASALLTNLADNGRLRPMTLEGTAVGSLELSTDFHPVNSSGNVEPRLWVFGALTEGARYFTLYIPSPKSRVRAFVDAKLCADEILGLR
jgi:uncharacterized NAD(P)/FAD-binding protein YdhS